MLVIYCSVSEVHECVAYLSKMTKTKLECIAEDITFYHTKFQDDLLLSLGDGCTNSKPKYSLRFVKVWS